MQSPKAIYATGMTQVDNFSFAIQWSDGTQRRYQLGELQKHCPCAHCSERRQAGLEGELPHRPDVRAVRIHSVGRYALRIEFTSGCSSGIYSYDFLYHFPPEPNLAVDVSKRSTEHKESLPVC